MSDVVPRVGQIEDELQSRLCRCRLCGCILLRKSEGTREWLNTQVNIRICRGILRKVSRLLRLDVLLDDLIEFGLEVECS